MCGRERTYKISDNGKMAPNTVVRFKKKKTRSCGSKLGSIVKESTKKVAGGQE